MTDRFCVNCKHYQVNDFAHRLWLECAHDDLSIVNLVTGERANRDVYVARTDKSALSFPVSAVRWCGPEGALFEPKQ